MDNLRVLITGASGFIGMPLINKLSALGCEVMALSRIPADIESNKNIHWHKANLSLPETYREDITAFSPNAVVHLSWQDIPDFSLKKSQYNLNQSLEFLSFVSEIKSCNKIIIAGTCLEYNKHNGKCIESDLGSPKDPFTWAKHALYSWLRMTCKQKNIQLIWMRIFYVYGPRQRPESLIPNVLKNLKEGRLPDLRTPKNANDFVYIEDVVDAFTKAISIDNDSMIYNLGSGIATPVLEVCRIAENLILGSDILTKQLEDNSKDTICDVDFWADNTQSKKYLDWQPNNTLEDGIKKTWQWFNE